MVKSRDDSCLIEQNKKLLNLLRFYKGIDRSELSKHLNVSMPTIYNTLDELFKSKMIIKNGNSVTINNDYGTLIGISIGASLCKIVFLNFDFKIIERDIFYEYKKIICKEFEKIIKDNDLLIRSKNDSKKNYIYFRTPKSFSDLKAVINRFFNLLQLWTNTEKLNILNIGISCTGIINNKTKTILDAHNLSYLSNRTLESLIYPDNQTFFEKNNIYLSLIQNSNASVISEKIFLNQSNSIYKSKKNIVAIYLGMGYGAGIYLNYLYEGTNGHAGEIGHIKAPVFESKEDIENCKRLISQGKVDKNCTCGSHDCYDYKIRSYVFEETADKFYDKSADDIRTYLDAKPQKAKLLGQYLGDMVNTITSFLDIDLVIFTGKIYKSMYLLLNHIDTIRDENPLKFNRNDCTILVSDYGSLSPSIGAAVYAYHQKYNLDFSWNY